MLKLKDYTYSSLLKPSLKETLTALANINVETININSELLYDKFHLVLANGEFTQDLADAIALYPEDSVDISAERNLITIDLMYHDNNGLDYLLDCLTSLAKLIATQVSNNHAEPVPSPEQFIKNSEAAQQVDSDVSQATSESDAAENLLDNDEADAPESNKSNLPEINEENSDGDINTAELFDGNEDKMSIDTNKDLNDTDIQNTLELAHQNGFDNFDNNQDSNLADTTPTENDANDLNSTDPEPETESSDESNIDSAHETLESDNTVNTNEKVIHNASSDTNINAINVTRLKDTINELIDNHHFDFVTHRDLENYASKTDIDDLKKRVDDLNTQIIKKTEAENLQYKNLINAFIEAGKVANEAKADKKPIDVFKQTLANIDDETAAALKSELGDTDDIKQAPITPVVSDDINKNLNTNDTLNSALTKLDSNTSLNDILGAFEDND